MGQTIAFGGLLGWAFRPAKSHEKWWGRRFRLPTLDRAWKPDPSSPATPRPPRCSRATSIASRTWSDERLFRNGWDRLSPLVVCWDGPFGPRNPMKNGGAGAFACQLLIG